MFNLRNDCVTVLKLRVLSHLVASLGLPVQLFRSIFVSQSNCHLSCKELTVLGQNVPSFHDVCIGKGQRNVGRPES